MATIEIEFDADALAKDLMDNMPEYGECLKCIRWNYKEGMFAFHDVDEDKKYTLSTKKVAETLPQFMAKCLKGEYNFFRGSEGTTILDAGNWDAWCVDGLVQEAIFGKVIYG